ncbi:MAG: sulfur carrier protein ThiS [Pseudomonadota bacterium]|jgi:sulfur carrier protein
MQLRINGDAYEIDNIGTVESLIAHLGYQQNSIAVAINKACVKRSDYASHPVRNGDDIEILAPMAGG